MLQWSHQASGERLRFDLAPTGALCYRNTAHDCAVGMVLISLPQERCATKFHVGT